MPLILKLTPVAVKNLRHINRNPILWGGKETSKAFVAYLTGFRTYCSWQRFFCSIPIATAQ
jgi:hypothetical protein